MGEIKQQLLVICGPTATGKTKLAFYLAKMLNGEIISADSRQVYKYMDIGTGKDTTTFGKVLGYDLVDPDEEFSVSQYAKFANNAIDKIYKQKALPILVGGTGFYIHAVIDGIDTIDISRDESLREKYKYKTSEELFDLLEKLDFGKANSMNNSDKNNSRRLIRAIEVAHKITSKRNLSLPNYDVLMIGLSTSLDELRRRVDERVEERIKIGFSDEVELLKKKGFWDGAPSRTLGYKDWPNIEKWKLEEFKYAKRQVTWFKRDARIKWFDVSKAGWEKEVELMAKKWYSQARYAEKN